MLFTLEDAAMLSRLIASRRTIGPPAMSDAPVERAQIELMLENANWAPTHGMTEPWRFVVYGGEARATLAAALSSLYAQTTPPEVFQASKQQKIAEQVNHAPYTIVVCMARDRSGRIPEVEELAAVACAVQNMHLTATALGLAAKWSTPAVCYAQEFATWLALDGDVRCLGLFYVGQPAGEWPAGRRTPSAAKVAWRSDALG